MKNTKNIDIKRRGLGKHMCVKYSLATIVIVCMLAGCQKANQDEQLTDWSPKLIENPASLKSNVPNLVTAPDGALYLTWIDQMANDIHRLRMARWVDEGWSEPTTIAKGSDWFVNWADFPSLVVHDDYMAAHWLVKSDKGTYDYDVNVSISQDLGKNWGEPFILHRDTVAAEHGFVSLLPTSDGSMFATWLDGRFTKDTTHANGGAMTLHATSFDADGDMSEETALDERICDCCQTDAIMTVNGPLVVYRDRSEDEVRDIYYTRHVADQWTKPKPVHADKWQIAGCPVNGPAAAAKGSQVAIVWFSASDEKPKVQLAISNDSGASFGKPIRLDHGNPSGRVDVAFLSDTRMVITWMERSPQGADVRATVINATGETLSEHVLVSTQASRTSGFPIIEKSGNKLMLAWTDTQEEHTQVKTAYVLLKEE